mgnify:CR=1 FL=1
MIPEITPDLANFLGHYVYAYVDPRNSEIFYVGKGVDSRATDHFKEIKESEKVTRIKEIIADGLTPRIDIISYHLRDDLEASRVEAAVIEAIGLNNLTNQVKGRFSIENPRRELKDLIIEHSPQEVEIDDPSILIRINKKFRYSMDSRELYECTRGIWVIGEKRRKRAKYAMAVYAGIVREVYEIADWSRAGTTEYFTRDQEELSKSKEKRWEFVGKVASETIRNKYLGGSVGHLFRKGQQSPITSVKI